jgi:hypothetical protein
MTVPVHVYGSRWLVRILRTAVKEFPKVGQRSAAHCSDVMSDVMSDGTLWVYVCRMAEPSRTRTRLYNRQQPDVQLCTAGTVPYSLRLFALYGLTVHKAVPVPYSVQLLKPAPHLCACSLQPAACCSCLLTITTAGFPLC